MGVAAARAAPGAGGRRAGSTAVGLRDAAVRQRLLTAPSPFGLPCSRPRPVHLYPDPTSAAPETHWQPLYRQRGPLQRVRHNKICAGDCHGVGCVRPERQTLSPVPRTTALTIKKRGVLLPDLVLLVSEALLDLIGIVCTA